MQGSTLSQTFFGKLSAVEQFVTPLIQVSLVWVTHHSWKPRQTMQFAVPSTALWLMFEGSVEVSDSQNEWEIGKEEAFLWSSASSRRVITPHGARWISVGMQINFFDNLDLSRALNLPVKWRPENEEWKSLSSCASELVRHWHGCEETLVDASTLATYSQQMEALRLKRAPIDVMIAESLGRALFGLCWKRLAKEEATQVMGKRVPPWLVETLSRIHDEPLLSVAVLAKDAGFSPAQFRRGFGEHVGVSPRSYLINNRLEIARRLLEENELPVSAVATCCGFSSLSHFIHMFKQSSGLSPLQYRQAGRSAQI